VREASWSMFPAAITTGILAFTNCGSLLLAQIRQHN
jgi:hypothetical protein